MIRLLLFFGFLLAGAAGLTAQSASSKKDPPPTLFIEVVYWGSWMERPLKYKSEGKLKAIPLQAGVSSRFLYTGPSPLVFFREEVSDPATQELKPVPILALPFAASCHHALLLVSPVKENTDPKAPRKDEELTAQLIPITPETFPPNTIYFANHSGRTLKCQLGNRSWEMNANDKNLFPVPGKNTRIHLIASAEWNGSWQVMYTDSFLTGDGERRVIYFHTPRGTESVAALAAIIAPDERHFDAKGRPIESAAVDPNGKALPRPTGIEGGWTGGPR